MEQTAYKFTSKHLGQAFLRELGEIGYEFVEDSYYHSGVVCILDNFGEYGLKNVGYNESDESYRRKTFQLETQWNEALEHARKQLEPEYKIDDWVISTKNSLLKIKEFNNKRAKGYGWDRSTNRCHWRDKLTVDIKRLAEKEEIESALIREAKRRGYKQTQTIKSAKYNKECFINNNHFDYDGLDDTLYLAGQAVYHGGQWAEIIDSKQFFGYDTKITDTEVTLGCKTFDRTTIERILDGLGALDNDLTISDIRKELKQIGIKP